MPLTPEQQALYGSALLKLESYFPTQEVADEGRGPMTEEAAAFMYFMLGVEEVRPV